MLVGTECVSEWEVPSTARAELSGRLTVVTVTGNPIDRGAWQTEVLGVAELDTTEQLNNKYYFHLTCQSPSSD